MRRKKGRHEFASPVRYRSSHEFSLIIIREGGKPQITQISANYFLQSLRLKKWEGILSNNSKSYFYAILKKIISKNS